VSRIRYAEDSGMDEVRFFVYTKGLKINPLYPMLDIQKAFEKALEEFEVGNR
jgi:hypothetical protein